MVRPRARVGESGEPAEELEILDRGHAEVEERAVARESDGAAGLAKPAPHRRSMERHRPRVGGERRGEDAREGGLAGTVGAGEQHQLAGMKLEGSSAKHGTMLEALPDVARAERHRVRVSVPGSPAPRRAAPEAAV